jgi:peptidoglycan/xylan/chitin deacetylase (PgdA/CDA1 family)
MKNIILIWDFDGPIGQINSTFPYNFNFNYLLQEIENVKWILSFLKEKNIKCCFAITGFSAEEGVYPYTFPDLIKQIDKEGHEVASHSWRHEWIPKFTINQFVKSIVRSKQSLEKVLNSKNEVVGFVPPHNRPMTWIQKGAFSLGDKFFYPISELGNNERVIRLLKENNYKWIRITYKSLFHRMKIKKNNISGLIYKHNGLLVLENHYNGFDQKIINHILNTNHETYTVSAHPLMLSLDYKTESKKNFINFIDSLLNANEDIRFVLPSSLI